MATNNVYKDMAGVVIQEGDTLSVFTPELKGKDYSVRMEQGRMVICYYDLQWDLKDFDKKSLLVTKRGENVLRYLKDLKKGDFFRLTASDTAPVWMRSDYERSSKKFSCYKYDNYNHENFFSGNKRVFTEFYF